MAKLQLAQGDISRFNAEAIVTAANSGLLGGSGVDGAVHAAAGPELIKECRKIGFCAVGSAKITKGYRLAAKYVIHAVGPVWYGGKNGERELLIGAYRASMELAIEHKVKSIAFPLISAGAFGYPKREALEVAISTLNGYAECGVEITLVLYDLATFLLAEKVRRTLK